MTPEQQKPEVTDLGIAVRFKARAVEIENAARRECAEKAFWEILMEKRDLLPSFVVRVEGIYDQYELRSGIYCEDRKIFRFFDEEKILYEAKFNRHCPVIRPISKVIEIPEMEQLLASAEKMTASQENKGKVVVPSGFFVFRYNAQQDTETGHGEEMIRTEVIKSGDLGEAMALLQKRISGYQQNCFWSFDMNTGEGWRPLGVSNYNFDGGVVSSSNKVTEGYFYEEGPIAGEGQKELVVYGEGQEFEEAIEELAQYEIPSKYRHIFNFHDSLPFYEGKVVLTDNGQSAATGLEKVKEYIKTRTKGPAWHGNPPTNKQLIFWFHSGDQEAERLYKSLDNRFRELSKIGTDLVCAEREGPPSLWKDEPANGFRIFNENNIEEEIDRIIKSLGEREKE